MNSEQKIVLYMALILILIIAVLLSGMYYMSTQSVMPPRQFDFPDQESLSALTSGKTVAIQLYLFDPRKDNLAKIDWILPGDNRMENLPDLVRGAFYKLEQPNQWEGLVSPIPPGSEIKKVFVDKFQNTLYLEFNEVFFNNHPGGSIEGWATIYSIVNTSCSVSPIINKVVFLKNGGPVRRGPGGWDCSRSFTAKGAGVYNYTS